MKDVMKNALTGLGIYLIIVVLALVFLNALVMDGIAFRVISFCVMVLVVAAVAFFEGGTKGEADSAHARLMEKRIATRGIEPTAAERQRYYKAWKGYAIAFIGAAPILLYALFVFGASLADQLQPWMTVSVRIALLPFISIFPDDVNMTWIYPVLALVYPVSLTVGYLMGPRRFAKLLRIMHENTEKRRKKQRAKRKKSVSAR